MFELICSDVRHKVCAEHRISMLDLCCFKGILVSKLIIIALMGLTLDVRFAYQKPLRLHHPSQCDFTGIGWHSRTYICNLFNTGSPFKGKVFVRSWVTRGTIENNLRFSMFNFSFTCFHHHKNTWLPQSKESAQESVAEFSKLPGFGFRIKILALLLCLNTDLTGKIDCTNSDFLRKTWEMTKWLGSSWKLFTYFKLLSTLGFITMTTIWGVCLTPLSKQI